MWERVKTVALQRFRWHIAETGGRALSNPEERGYNLFRETRGVAVGLTAREISDYLFQYGDPNDIVVLDPEAGVQVVWTSLSGFLAEDSEAQRYGFPPSNVDGSLAGEEWEI